MDDYVSLGVRDALDASRRPAEAQGARGRLLHRRYVALDRRGVLAQRRTTTARAHDAARGPDGLQRTGELSLFINPA